ncbi:MAG: hypothetical protein Q9194_002501 [Teloschistes cf. exilis]
MATTSREPWLTARLTADTSGLKLSACQFFNHCHHITTAESSDHHDLEHQPRITGRLVGQETPWIPFPAENAADAIAWSTQTISGDGRISLSKEERRLALEEINLHRLTAHATLTLSLAELTECYGYAAIVLCIARPEHQDNESEWPRACKILRSRSELFDIDAEIALAESYGRYAGAVLYIARPLLLEDKAEIEAASDILKSRARPIDLDTSAFWAIIISIVSFPLDKFVTPIKAKVEDPSKRVDIFGFLLVATIIITISVSTASEDLFTIGRDLKQSG